MSDMDTVTDLAGIDIEVVVPAVAGEPACVQECDEEVEVGKFTATLPYQLATGRGARAGSGGGGADMGRAGE